LLSSIINGSLELARKHGLTLQQIGITVIAFTLNNLRIKAYYSDECYF